MREQQKNKLYSTIWNIAKNLRGSIDGWDFKSYVLGILFYRFISENLTKFINDDDIEKDKYFDYSCLNDNDITDETKEDIVKEKGYFIYPSELFQNVYKKAKNDPNLNETLFNIFKNIENSALGTESEDDIKGLFDDIDFNNVKLGKNISQRNQKLLSCITEIAQFNLTGDYQDSNIDIFGDAYEYLISMYASDAGKSGGEYFTPKEVSKLLAKIVTLNKSNIKKVYDPTCGSGSLLLEVSKHTDRRDIAFYGQEINHTSYNLCRINMFLHNINYDKFDIKNADTLINPQHDNIKFDVIVSNPPYSIPWEGKSNPLLINDDRFSPAGVLAPESKADLAFVMHILYCLCPDGIAAIVEFPGVLYRGGSEAKIREYLVKNNYIDVIIQLPTNLFFGNSIATCIIVLKKNKSDNNILFVDASDEFVKSGNKNKLSDENIQKILITIENRKDIEHFAYLSSCENIKENNNYNLSVNKYVLKKNTQEKIDITELNKQIKECVEKQNKLKFEIDNIIKDYF